MDGADLYAGDADLGASDRDSEAGHADCEADHRVRQAGRRESGESAHLLKRVELRKYTRKP